MKLRREVAAFAQLMEAKLREHDHKGGWKYESTTYLSRRLGNELQELREAISAQHKELMNGWPPISAENRTNLAYPVDTLRPNL